MGMSLGKLFAGGTPPGTRRRVVMVGLDGTGKTTILYKLKVGETITTHIPTIAFNFEDIEYKNTNISLWDVGGQQRYEIRPYWKNYLFDAQGIVFVVDSFDRDRIEEAKDFLYMLLDEGNVMDDACLLVFANKQDVTDVMTASEITEKLLLPSLTQRKWHVQRSCATSGEGLHEGLDWLLNNVHISSEKPSEDPLKTGMSSLAKLFAGIFPEKEKDKRIMMVGLDATGKTTILYKLQTGETISTNIPTIGFNVESVKYKNINFTLWDIGGQPRYKIRPLYKHYFFDVQGVVFVVDSADRDRIEEARDFLYMVLDEGNVTDDVCLLVFANKQDIAGSMSPSEITHKLLLPSLAQRKWHVQSSCATSGEGLHEGIEWLLNNVQTQRRII